MGPVTEGQPENEFQYVIVDPGTRAFEVINSGLFYTLVSSVTTIGITDTKFSSAIYFFGTNLK